MAKDKRYGVHRPSLVLHLNEMNGTGDDVPGETSSPNGHDNMSNIWNVGTFHSIQTAMAKAIALQKEHVIDVTGRMIDIHLNHSSVLNPDVGFSIDFRRYRPFSYTIYSV